MTRRLLPALLGLALVAQPAWASEPEDLLGGGPEEAELLRSVRARKLIRAREQAEKILRLRPSSIIARHGLAVVFHDEEGNLPRALYHNRLAERHLAERFGAAPREHAAQTWHKRLLEEQEEILGEMDRREEQLRVMDRYDALYRPNLDRRRIWPLMKLHRFDEARRLARQVALSEDIQIRIAGLNGMIAIESEQLKAKETFEVGMRAVEATGNQSCILLENTAEAAFAVYRFADAEKLALRSLQARMKDCPASAYPHLANLYLLRADFQRAMQAVKSAREHGIERRYRQQFEMGNQGWLARLLYSLGQFEKARELAERVTRAPDRVGMTSFSLDLMRAIALVDHHAMLEAQSAALREQASARPLVARVKSWLRERALAQEAWLLRRRVARFLARGDMLLHLVRPYFKPLPPWHAGALVTAAGSGVVARALAEARRRERMARETEPYFTALEAELAWRAGSHARALELGRGAIARLPKDEVLLRGRVEAIAADAARRTGRAAEAEPLLHRVLDRFPTALRLLGIRLPVDDIRASGDPLARAVASALHRSPRLLVAGGSGRAVVVTVEKKQVRVCLTGRGGRRYACAEKEVGGGKTEEEKVALAADEFHAKVFAPKIDLTQRDINSLDGSAVRGDADEVLKQVLGP
jgi:tetratricopeptide (TPR) repeat protein